MAEKIPPRTGGLESTLDSIGLLYLIASLIGLGACIYLSQQANIRKLELSTFFIGLGVATAAQGFVFQTLFKATAELIRLMKKLNGLPYGGSLSMSEGEGRDFICSDCLEPVSKRDKFCTQCGAEL